MARLTIRSHPRHRPLGSSRLPQKLPSRPAALEDSSRTGDPETMDIELRNGDPAALQPARKVKNSASAAGVFMKKRKEQRLARKQRKLRTPTTESTSGNVAANVTDSVDEARRAIDASQNAAFENIYNLFLSSMDGSGAQDDAFIESLTDALKILTVPLTEEQIEATFKRDDTPVTEIIQMGKRIGMFQESVVKDEAKLSGYWKEWEELQDDFIELGCEVFGKVAFPTSVVVKNLMREGFVRDMEMVTQECSTMVEDMAEHIEELGFRLLKELVASEEEHDAGAKKGKVMLFQALI